MINNIKSFVESNKKSIVVAVAGGLSTVSVSAHAAIDSSVVDGIVAAVTADAGIAIAAGFSILAVVLGGRVGFGLVKSFIASGAS